MAKVKPVERLRPTNTGIAPTISIRDNYTKPVGLPLNQIDSPARDIANFLAQASPKIQQLNKDRIKAEERVNMIKALDIDYQNPDGSYKTMEQLQESGELHFATPEVVMERNKALGAQIGRDLNMKMNDWYQENAVSGRVYQWDAATFQEKWDDHFGSLLQNENVKSALLEPGTKAAMKNQVHALFSQKLSSQQSGAEKYAIEQSVNAMATELDTYVDTGFNDAQSTASNFNAFTEEKASAGMYRGNFTELNGRMAGYLKGKIENAQTTHEVDYWMDVVRGMKAGSGSLEGTKHWKEANTHWNRSAADLLTTAENRLVRLEGIQNTREARIESDETEAYMNAYYEHLVKNHGNGDDFKYNGKTTQLDAAKIAQIENSAHSTFASGDNRPMTTDRFNLIRDQFIGLNPVAAELKKQQMLRGKDPMVGVMSRSEQQNLNSIITNFTTDAAIERQTRIYKDSIRILKEKYAVADFLSGAARSNVTSPAQEQYYKAEAEFEADMQNFFLNPSAYISEIYSGQPDTLEKLKKLNPSQMTSMIMNDVQLEHRARSHFIGRVMETFPPVFANPTGDIDPVNGAPPTSTMSNVGGVPVTEKVNSGGNR